MTAPVTIQLVIDAFLRNSKFPFAPWKIGMLNDLYLTEQSRAPRENIAADKSGDND